MQCEEGTDWLLELLLEVQLQQYFLRIRDDLNVTRLSHFDYVKNEDLEKIGMGRPGESRKGFPLFSSSEGFRRRYELIFCGGGGQLLKPWGAQIKTNYAPLPLLYSCGFTSIPPSNMSLICTAVISLSPFLLIKDRDDCGKPSKGRRPCASASPG